METIRWSRFFLSVILTFLHLQPVTVSPICLLFLAYVYIHIQAPILFHKIAWPAVTVLLKILI